MKRVSVFIQHILAGKVLPALLLLGILVFSSATPSRGYTKQVTTETVFNSFAKRKSFTVLRHRQEPSWSTYSSHDVLLSSYHSALNRLTLLCLSGRPCEPLCRTWLQHIHWSLYEESSPAS